MFHDFVTHWGLWTLARKWVNYVDIDKLILKFIWRSKRYRIGKTILKEKNKVGGLTLPKFKTYSQAVVIKRVWYWGKNRQIDQWNGIDIPETDPHKYSQLIFDKRAKAIRWNKDSLFNKWHWKT